MSKSSDRIRRSYTIINPQLIRARLLPRDPQGKNCCVAELREMAPFGAKLLVHGAPELRYECQLALDSPQLPRPLVIPAEMQWARPNPAGNWLLGCGFEPTLAPEIFDELLNSGLLERRSAVRRPTRIQVQVQWRARKPRVTALVCDISEGGLCLTTAIAPDSKHDVCIFGSVADTEVRVPLQVRWSMSVGPNYFIGCEFMRHSDYAVVRKMQPAARNPLRAPMQSAAESSSAARL